MNKYNIRYLNRVDSTNLIIKKEALNGEKEGLVVVANEQTAGKGRLGRYFESPSNTGIYMSILLRPRCAIEKALFITTTAAVAVCEAVEYTYKCASRLKYDVKINGEPKIKWVNDIYMNNRKICGILTESGVATNGNYLDYAVLGIGVNVFEPIEGFSENIDSIAGATFNKKSIYDDEICEKVRRTFIGAILDSFFKYYEHLDDNANTIIFEEYKRRNFILGNKIMVVRNDNNISAKAIDIDDNYGLIVEYEDGSKEVLNSGEISIRL